MKLVFIIHLCSVSFSMPLPFVLMLLSLLLLLFLCIALVVQYNIEHIVFGKIKMHRMGVVAIIRSHKYPLFAKLNQMHARIFFLVFLNSLLLLMTLFSGCQQTLFEDAAIPHNFPLNRCNCAELIYSFIRFAFLHRDTFRQKKRKKNLSLFCCASRFSANCARFARDHFEPIHKR